MNKQEAKELMEQGVKMSHVLFDPDEYLTLNKDGRLEDNMGYTHPYVALMENRSGLFDEGWKRFKGQIDTCDHDCKHVSQGPYEPVYCSNCGAEL